jgi:hypothetical protein
MTRTGAAKRVAASYALGRLRKAVAFHEVARIAAEQIERIGDPDPVLSNAILAAIAYTDAITAAFGGEVNSKDHAAAAKLLRDSLGAELPDAQERRLVRLLGSKDEVQYGARAGRRDHAAARIEDLEAFARWAVALLAERGLRRGDSGGDA